MLMYATEIRAGDRILVDVKDPMTQFLCVYNNWSYVHSVIIPLQDNGKRGENVHIKLHMLGRDDLFTLVVNEHKMFNTIRQGSVEEMAEIGDMNYAYLSTNSRA